MRTTLMAVLGFIFYGALPATAQDADTVIVKEKEVVVVKNGASQILVRNDSVYIDGKGYSMEEFRERNQRAATVRGYTYRSDKDRGQRTRQTYLGVYTVDDDAGVLITRIERNSPAHVYKLRDRDIINSIAGKPVRTTAALSEVVRGLTPGEKVPIVVTRGSKKIKLEIVPSEMEGDADGAFFNEERNRLAQPVPPVPPIPPMIVEGFNLDNYFNARPKYGMSVEDNPSGDGALVKTIEDKSMAMDAGLQPEDLIVEVEGKPVKNIDVLRAQLFRLRSQATIQLKVMRNGSAQEIQLRVPKVIKKADL